MTYRDPEQALGGPIEDIVKDIDVLRERIKNRRRAEEDGWGQEHLDELQGAEHAMLDLECLLLRIKEGTW